MTKSKKIVLFLIGVIFILLSVFIILPNKNKKKNVSTNPIIPTPAISKLFKQEMPISTINGKFNFPNTLNVYKITHKYLTKDYVSSIAENLNFDSKINEGKDYKEGLKYYTIDQSKSLWVTPSRSLVKYELNKLPLSVKNENLSIATVKDLAERFIKEKLEIDIKNYKVFNMEYYSYRVSTNGAKFSSANESEYDFIHIVFTLSDLEYPLFTSASNQTPVFVDVMKDGNILNANITAISSYSVYSNQNIKNIDDIKSTLDQSALLEIEGEYISIPEVKPKDLKDINIDKINIVYLIDESYNGIIQPVFLMEGDVKLLNTNATGVKILLPASKN